MFVLHNASTNSNETQVKYNADEWHIFSLGHAVHCNRLAQKPVSPLFDLRKHPITAASTTYATTCVKLVNRIIGWITFS